MFVGGLAIGEVLGILTKHLQAQRDPRFASSSPLFISVLLAAKIVDLG